MTRVLVAEGPWHDLLVGALRPTVDTEPATPLISGEIGSYEGVTIRTSSRVRLPIDPAIKVQSSDPAIREWNARIEARNRMKGKRP
jgi:hypothetical protein